MMITGPCGQIEAAIDEPDPAAELTQTVAILCHPHPQYGGSMHDQVLNTVAGALTAQGITCLRFNFRGTGASDGHFDNGTGEVEDLKAVYHWVQTEYAGKAIGLVGYSFGAAMVWQAIPQLSHALAILIAPPIGAMPFAAHQGGATTCSPQLISGDCDAYVDLDRAAELANVDLHIINGADHFFQMHGPELTSTVTAIVRTSLAAAPS